MNPSRTATRSVVEEIQGLYGPFAFSEKLLQRIWARRGFDARVARTLDGRRVEILQAGRWNGLGGPDFMQSRLRLGGVPVTGDVEVHLREQDWAAHGHSADPAYRNVVLHVVLFPVPQSFTLGVEGRAIPILSLLPLLPHDLEEYAAEAAIEALSGRPAVQVPRALAALTPEAVAELLRGQARQRWDMKVAWAARRIGRLGWTEACHHTALEILGYRFNRSPMLAVATRFPLESWRVGGLDLETVWSAERESWRVQGVRPANQPRVRLRQYAAWVAARPDWTDRLRRAAEALPVLPALGETGRLRRLHGLAGWRLRLATDICGGGVGGTRFDNLVGDGFLPLLTAESGVDAAGLWWHWLAGDQPAALTAVLRMLGVFAGPARPAALGPVQGLLGWLLANGVDTTARG